MNKIIVNGQTTTIINSGRFISYDFLVALAHGEQPRDIIHDITYRRGHKEDESGSLNRGKSVKLKDGMIFNVAVTDNN